MSATPDILAQYPNSWDVPEVTPIDPFALTRNYLSTSPYCVLHPDGTPCNQFRILDNRRPLADAGGNREVKMKDLAAGGSLVLDGSGSRDADGKIVGYEWSKISGRRGLHDKHSTKCRDSPHRFNFWYLYVFFTCHR